MWLSTVESNLAPPVFELAALPPLLELAGLSHKSAAVLYFLHLSISALILDLFAIQAAEASLSTLH